MANHKFVLSRGMGEEFPLPRHWVASPGGTREKFQPSRYPAQHLGSLCAQGWPLKMAKLNRADRALFLSGIQLGVWFEAPGVWMNPKERLWVFDVRFQQRVSVIQIAFRTIAKPARR